MARNPAAQRSLAGAVAAGGVAREGAPPTRSGAGAFGAAAARAGLPLSIPEGISRHCCGTPYSSKGFEQAHALAINATVEALWRASREGVLPVVVDTSPCTQGLLNRDGLTRGNLPRAARMQIVDAVEFFAVRVLPQLYVRRRAGPVTLP